MNEGKKTQQDINGTTEHSMNQINCTDVRKMMTTLTSKWPQAWLETSYFFFNTIIKIF